MEEIKQEQLIRQQVEEEMTDRKCYVYRWF
ncbi:hypothetical protein EP10_002438 [Geobacillus icigianus]|uniref:Uncharacterized protein n=1 Tax=Geobacillus icigianus TaxID=1430331 RepID=A0ABU6BHW1_9BACL|nr:hypothetical protein [Geobacillus icigianus]